MQDLKKTNRVALRHSLNEAMARPVITSHRQQKPGASMNFLSPIGTLLWDNFDLILFGFLALLAIEELNSDFSMIELARNGRKANPKGQEK